MRGWIASLALGWAMAAAAAPVRTVFPNGLTLVVEEDHAAPVAIVEIWVRAGGRDEAPGKTGLAHMLEHMMFEGTHKLAPGAFSKRIEAFGGRDNAFTSHDYTAYFEIVPAERLDEALTLEFDRFTDLVIRDDVFRRERRVVMEERRMRLEDDPTARFFEELSAAALKLHPYRNPVIGWMQDIARLTPEDARAFYARFYRNPAN
ncbi:MAG: insulinase family protein, partial [Zetaproteobacteria bacterium]